MTLAVIICIQCPSKRCSLISMTPNQNNHPQTPVSCSDHGAFYRTYDFCLAKIASCICVDMKRVCSCTDWIRLAKNLLTSYDVFMHQGAVLPHMATTGFWLQGNCFHNYPKYASDPLTSIREQHTLFFLEMFAIAIKFDSSPEPRPPLPRQGRLPMCM